MSYASISTHGGGGGDVRQIKFSWILFVELVKSNLMQWRIQDFPQEGVNLFITSRKTKFEKGNVFTPVCQSFCPQDGDVCLWVQGTHPVDTYPFPQNTPKRRTPGHTPTPVDVVCDRGGHWSGRYASYWNAFFFFKVFTTNCMKMKEIGQRRRVRP